jgi:hypothetical protein
MLVFPYGDVCIFVNFSKSIERERAAQIALKRSVFTVTGSMESLNARFFLKDLPQTMQS